MTRPMRVVHPEEDTAGRRRRTPTWLRVRHVCIAVLALDTKGYLEPQAREIAREIDARLNPGAISTAINMLLATGAIRCTTPEKTRNRHYCINRRDKVVAFAEALAESDIDAEAFDAVGAPKAPPEEVPSERPGWFRRTFTNTEQLARIEEKLDRLLDLWET